MRTGRSTTLRIAPEVRLANARSRAVASEALLTSACRGASPAASSSAEVPISVTRSPADTA